MLMRAFNPLPPPEPDTEKLIVGYKEMSNYFERKHGVVTLTPKRLSEYAQYPSMKLPVKKPNQRLTMARPSDLDKWVIWWLDGMKGKPPVY